MIVGHDVFSPLRGAGGNRIGIKRIADLQGLGRLYPCTDYAAGNARQVHLHDPCAFLGPHAVAGRGAELGVCLPQHEGRSDVGCPAKGISATGVKIRTRAVFAASRGGSTNVPSDQLNSLAMRCMAVAPKRRASGMTASGLPLNRVDVNVDGGELDTSHRGPRLHLNVRPRQATAAVAATSE